MTRASSRRGFRCTAALVCLLLSAAAWAADSHEARRHDPVVQLKADAHRLRAGVRRDARVLRRSVARDARQLRRGVTSDAHRLRRRWRSARRGWRAGLHRTNQRIRRWWGRTSQRPRGPRVATAATAAAGASWRPPAAGGESFQRRCVQVQSAGCRRINASSSCA